MRFFAEFFECFWIAGDAVRANKLRAALTTLGIIIGIVTVTLMATAIDGLNRAFLQSISALGADVLYATRIDWMIDSHEQWMKVSRRRVIDMEQVREVERQMKLAEAVAPFVETGAAVRFGNHRSDNVAVIGTTDQFRITSGMTMASGRFFSTEESSGGRPVCVVGWQVATNLFVTEEPVGQRIKVGGNTFDVVGVAEKQGEFLGAFSLDNQVFIPVRQFTTGFWRDPDFQINVKVGNPRKIEEARYELRGLLRKVRHVAPGAEDDFAIEQQETIIKTFNRVGGIIASIGLFITGLSLFVGGIGIMNIMFVSVAERTKEIGIRKAIGAKRRSILLQFLLEAALICLIGGVIGLAIAWPLTLLLGRFMPAVMSLTVVGLALGISAFTGVIAGFLPAWRAAKLDPVDALRAE